MATGGLAYGEVKVTGTSMDSGFGFGGPFSGIAPIGASKVKAGWTLGAGIEGALAGRWTWKAEYLYVDLGSLDFSSPGPFRQEKRSTVTSASPPISCAAASTITSDRALRQTASPPVNRPGAFCFRACY